MCKYIKLLNPSPCEFSFNNKPSISYLARVIFLIKSFTSSSSTSISSNNLPICPPLVFATSCIVVSRDFIDEFCIFAFASDLSICSNNISGSFFVVAIQDSSFLSSDITRLLIPFDTSFSLSSRSLLTASMFSKLNNFLKLGNSIKLRFLYSSLQ